MDAQLFQSRDQLTVKKDGLDLQLFSPKADPDRAMEALGIAVERSCTSDSAGDLCGLSIRR